MKYKINSDVIDISHSRRDQIIDVPDNAEYVTIVGISSVSNACVYWLEPIGDDEK
ncbi:MAG: hypothetical protein GQ576_00160 [Methanococcoides sp.]|nr:hypothetical protein [Methanococcoides sp.]